MSTLNELQAQQPLLTRRPTQYSAERYNQKHRGFMGFIKNLKRAENKPSDEFTVESGRRFLFDDRAALLRDATIPELFRREEPPEVDFNDIVDADDRRVEVFVSQELVGKLIDSGYFKAFIFGLIVVNAILIALQVNEKWSMEHRSLLSVFDQLVIAIFICEILLKWYYGFWVFWKSGWNVGDFLVISALVFGPQLSFLSSSRILRILRVVRAFRSLRSVSGLAGLSMVIQTILQSVPDMANIMGLCIIIFLVLGVSGVTLFSKYVPNTFGDLPSAMYTMFICFTQDGWAELIKEFENHGTYVLVGGALFFVVSITIGAFIFANLVVAVVVTNLEMAMKQIRAERNSMIDTLDTGSHRADYDDGDQPDDKHVVHVVKFSKIEKTFEPASQTMLEVANLKGLNTDNITKYFTLLLALEENLCEYEGIKDDLKKIHEVVEELNEVEPEEDLEGIDSRENLASAATVSKIEETLKTGDILSNLMKLEESSLVQFNDGLGTGMIMKNAPRRSSVATSRPRARSVDVVSGVIARRMSLRVQDSFFSDVDPVTSSSSSSRTRRIAEEQPGPRPGPSKSSDEPPSGSGSGLALGRVTGSKARQTLMPVVAEVSRPMRRGSALFPVRSHSKVLKKGSQSRLDE